jgi:hypothetical protein
MTTAILISAHFPKTQEPTAMLRRTTWAVIAAVGFPAVAHAQLPVLPPIRTGLDSAVARPTISPYLNLLRRDGGIGFQYYLRVRPEQEFLAANQQQSQALRSLGRQIEEIGRPASKSLGGGLGTTGHPTAFQSYGGSFRGAPQSPRPTPQR